jgi:hypothetical protein
MSGHHPVALPSAEPFTGGRTLMLAAAGAGAVGLVLTGLGMFLDRTPALASYLVAFTYWIGISLAALLLLCAFHAANAKWITAFRRIFEVKALAVLVFIPLFIPIALGMKNLFQWVDPPVGLPAHELHAIHHKHGYLNVPFFLIRAAGYFAVWAAVSWFLNTWSLEARDPARSLIKQRKLASGSLPFLALTVTFASVDWVMSVEPTYFSTLFGVYYAAGSFLGFLCLTVIILAFTRQPGQPGSLVTEAHFHNLGKLMLALTAFWAYSAYSNYMLTWVANIPEETPWYIKRAYVGWMPVGVGLFIGHFVIPFVLLLSQQLKLKPKLLAGVAFWLLAWHFVDLVWLVMPAYDATAPSLRWTDFTAFIGVGGVAIAFAVFLFRGKPLAPTHDPYLSDSLQYTQP